MNNKRKAELLPPMGYEFTLGSLVFKVTYRNVGQVRFTAALIGKMVEKDKDQGVKVVSESGN